ncbi:MAG: hypothetical protein J0M12_03230 [Deltaproteobacteria bacterium]|nr:hypothetical protein [Deltaproteobacteria bacterium]
MTQTPTQQSSKQLKAVSLVVWGAMLTSVAVMTLICYSVAQQLSAAHSGNSQVESMLQLNAVLIAVGAFWVRSRLISGRPFGLTQSKPQQGDAVRSSFAESRSEVSAEAIKRMFPTFVIALAVSEAVAIIGMCNAMLTKVPDAILPYSGVSVLLIASLFPKWEDWVRGS